MRHLKSFETNNDAQGNGFYVPIVSYEADSV